MVDNLYTKARKIEEKRKKKQYSTEKKEFQNIVRKSNEMKTVEKE